MKTASRGRIGFAGIKEPVKSSASGQDLNCNLEEWWKSSSRTMVLEMQERSFSFWKDRDFRYHGMRQEKLILEKEWQQKHFTRQCRCLSSVSFGRRWQNGCTGCSQRHWFCMLEASGLDAADCGFTIICSDDTSFVQVRLFLFSA